MGAAVDQTKELGSMDIPLDRPSRARSLIVYVILLLAVAGTFAWMLAKFTGSGMIALGLSLGMLVYMLIVASWAHRNLRGPGE